MTFPDTAEVTQALESAESSGVGEGAPEAAPSITELDKLEKFKFDGQEYTPKDLKAAILRQQDYTRKTQEFSQDRKFYDHLSLDLGTIRKNPALASEFRRVYPEKFHAYLEHVLGDSQNTPTSREANPGSSQAQKYAQLDPQLISRFERIEATVQEKEVAALELNLEAQEKQMISKYPMADLETVYSKAQAFLDRNKELPKDQHTSLTPELWDRIYKADHEKNQKRYETHYKENINKQKQAGLNGRDSGSGGGMPGGAPKTYRSIREATDAALADLDS